jgi:uncharacterized membrane protein (DUF485 family)
MNERLTHLAEYVCEPAQTLGEDGMQPDVDERAMRLWNDPRFRDLLRRRDRFAIILTVILSIVYFGFILLIAFDKPLMGAPIAGGTTSIGIVLGLGMILFTLFLTGWYIWRANRDFDVLADQLLAEASQ